MRTLLYYIVSCVYCWQLQDELDELQRQLDMRQGNYGNSLSSVHMIAEAFGAFVKAADAVEGRVREFMSTADRMMKDPVLDSRRIRHEVDETERRWRTFYNSIRSYGAALADSAKFFDNWQAVCIPADVQGGPTTVKLKFSFYFCTLFLCFIF